MPVVRGISNPEIVQAPEYPPSDESLQRQALDFVKGCKPKSYRQMKKDDDLQEYLELKAKAAKRTAQNLIESGVFVNQAWNMAIRQEILESDSD